MSRPADDRVPDGHRLDEVTGEIVPICERCDLLEDQIAGLQRDIRGWAIRYRNLERDKEKEARAHDLWPVVKDLFDYWREECHHPKARFNAARFKEALPFVEQDGPDLCRQAIRGAAFDPFVTTRRNGKQKRHDDWDLIFRPGRKQFEEFAERAPVPGAEPSELKRMAAAILARMPEDDRPTEERIREAVEQANVELRRRGR
jgi:hypothetical protein